VQVLEDFLGYILLGRLTAQATTFLINSRDGERGASRKYKLFFIIFSFQILK
jgi:hypothetical protein